MSVKRRTNKKRAKSKRKKTQKSTRTKAFSSINRASINRRTTGGRKKRTKSSKRRKTPTRTTAYGLTKWDYLDDRPDNCGDICYGWHKRTKGDKISNPQKMVKAFEEAEKKPLYQACCAPDRPLQLMYDLSNASDVALGKARWNRDGTDTIVSNYWNRR
jgi:phage gp16-like protein